jgi:hypothetical protein
MVVSIQNKWEKILSLQDRSKTGLKQRGSEQMVSFRSIIAFRLIPFFVTFFLHICDTHAKSNVPSASGLDATSSEAQKEEGRNKSPSGVGVRWKEGLYLGYQYRDIFSLEFGGLLSVDGGYIDANQVLQNSYPSLQGWAGVLRNVKVSLVAAWVDDGRANISQSRFQVAF